MNAVTHKERFDIGVLTAETAVKVGRILSAAARKHIVTEAVGRGLVEDAVLFKICESIASSTSAHL